MRHDDVERLAGWLRATDIGLLELRGPGTGLRLRHEGGAVHAETIDDECVVKSASVGVLLHRHPLRSDDLAAAGSAVEAGQVLALLQVGPLLLPVHAPAAGRLLAWQVAHGAAVGWGTPLATISTTG